MAYGIGIEVMILLAALLFVAWPGDRLVDSFVKTLPSKSLLRATDTLVHGIIGALSWQLVCTMKPHLHFDVTFLLSHLSFKYKGLSEREKPAFISITIVFNMFVAFALASAVDLDHVLKDVVHWAQGREPTPWQRGWFHLALPPLLLTLLLYITGIVFRSLCCVRVGTFVVLCIVGHQIRDATHHGLWLQPLGVTPRFPFWLYVSLTMLFPFIASGVVTLLLKRVLFSQSSASLSVV